MKRSTFRLLVASIFFITMISLAQAQNEIRKLIQGKEGLARHFTKLTKDKQIPFFPSQAKTILGLDQNSDMIFMKADHDKMGQSHYRFNQSYQGIPIENAIYIMHTKENILTCLNGSLVLDFSEVVRHKTNAKLSAEDAIQIALRIVNAKYYAWQSDEMEKRLQKIKGNKFSYYPSPTLVWYSGETKLDPSNMHLAYKLDIYAFDPLSRAYYFVDAQNGQLLGSKNEISFSDATGSANTAYSGSQTIHSDSYSGSYRLRDYTKGNGVITLHGDQTGNPDYTNSSSTWSLTGADQYSLDVHYAASQTYDFYYSNFNRNSIDDNGYNLISYVNDTNAIMIDNALWNGTECVFGVLSSNGNGFAAIDVVGHEFTHGLTQAISGLDGSYEPGAINESISDIMGKSIQFWSKPLDINWTHSNDMSHLIRSMDNPNLYGDPDTYHGTNWYYGSGDLGGVHTNNGVGNFMFYLLAEGGSGTNDLSTPYLVSGIGLAEADAIIYGSEFYLTSLSQYTDWRLACIQAATDLYGSNSNEVKQVDNAFCAVGVSLECDQEMVLENFVTPSIATICSADNTTLFLSGGPTSCISGLDPHWQSSPDSINWTNISGASSISYTTPSLTSTTYYRNLITCSITGDTVISDTSRVDIFPLPTAFNVTGGGTYCSGGSGLAIGLSGSQTGVTYQLIKAGSNIGSPVSGTGSAISFGNQTASGTYTLVATHTAMGCVNTMTGSATITIASHPTISITGRSSTAACISDTLFATTGYASYLWSTGQTTSSIIVTAVSSTTYSVVVTNSDGCTSTTSKTVAIDSLQIYPVSQGFMGGIDGGIGRLCLPHEDTTVTLSVPSGYLSYSWSPNGETIDSIVVSDTGLYTVNVTGANGCSTSANFRVLAYPVPPRVSVTPSGPINACWDGINSVDVILTVDTSGFGAPPGSPIDLYWSDIFSTGGTELIISAVDYAPYTNNEWSNFYVTLTNQVFCYSISDTVVVNFVLGPTISSTNSNTFCQGDTIIVNGTDFNATSNVEFNGVNTGFRIVSDSEIHAHIPLNATSGILTIFKSNGCSAFTDSIIVNPLPPTTSITPSGPINACWDGINSIDVILTVDTSGFGSPPGSPINIAWSDIFGTSETSVVISANIYDPDWPNWTEFYVTFTNAAGCSSVSTDTVIVNFLRGPTITSTNSDTLCQGDTIIVNGHDFNATSNVEFNGVNTGFRIVSDTVIRACIPLNATSGILTVFKSNGCTAATDSIVVNPLPNISISHSNKFLCELFRDTVVLTANGGLTYLWSTSQTTQNITVESGSPYSVIGTDINGCRNTAYDTIIFDRVIHLTGIVTDVSTTGGNDGAIDLTPSGGTLPYTYSWSPGSATTQDIASLVSNVYTVTVTDSAGCITTESFQVTEPDTIDCSAFRTQTQGGWGQDVHGHNAASILYHAFSSVFISPDYLKVGCNSGYTLQFTTYQAIHDFLPCGTVPSTLTSTQTNPSCFNNVFASQVLTLAINLAFDLAIDTFSLSTSHLRDLYIAAGPFQGWTVQQVFDTANTKLGGCSSNYSTSDLNSMVDSINNSFENGNCVQCNIFTCTQPDRILNARFFIQGFYLGSHVMKPVLLNSGVSGALSSQTDTVIIELHDTTSGYSLVDSCKGIVDTSGNITCHFSQPVVGHAYYIVVKHRNSIETWSANPVTIGITTNYDFSTANTKSFGNNMTDRYNEGIWFVFSGDLNQDGVIDITDYNILEPAVLNINSGYVVSDVTGDGSTDGSEYILLQGATFTVRFCHRP